MKREREDDSDDEEVYMTVAERKRLAKAQLQAKKGGDSRLQKLVAKENVIEDDYNEEEDEEEEENIDDDNEEQMMKRLKKEIAAPAQSRENLSLLDQAYVMKKKEAENPYESHINKIKNEEEDIMKQVTIIYIYIYIYIYIFI